MSGSTANTVAPSESISNVPGPETNVTVPSRGKRGSRGKGRGGRQSRVQETARGAYSQVGSGIARPQHLSTTSTATKDDPMLIDEFSVSGADHLVPNRFIPDVALDHLGYHDLVKDVYLQMTISDKSMSSRLPLALFELYCNNALWYRYLALSVAFGRREVDNVVLLEVFRSVKWHLPEPIKRYLDGIGEFRAPSGDKFQILSPPGWPDSNVGLVDLPGHYGQFDANSSMNYASYPAPFISAYNVLASMARHQNLGWGADLPAAMLPTDDLPEGQTWFLTRNLSNFNPLDNLTSKQNSVLLNLGFSVQANGVYNYSMNRLGFNGEVASYVSSSLVQTATYKIVEFTNLVASGTISLVPFTSVPTLQPSDVRKSFLMGNHSLEVRSSFDLESRISSASLLMSFRLTRGTFRDGRCNALPFTVVNEQNQLAPVPVGYRNNLNSNFARGASARLNVEYFNTNPVSRRDVLLEMTRAFVKA